MLKNINQQPATNPLNQKNGCDLSGIVFLKPESIENLGDIFSDSCMDDEKNLKYDMEQDGLSIIPENDAFSDFDNDEKFEMSIKKKIRKHKNCLKKKEAPKKYQNALKGVKKIGVFPYYTPMTGVRIMETYLPLDSRYFVNSASTGFDLSALGDLSRFKAISKQVNDKENHQYIFNLEEKKIH